MDSCDGDEIDIQGLTLLDNSSFYQEQISFGVHWFDDEYGMNRIDDNLQNESTIEDYSLTFTESTLNETIEADSSLHLSDRLSPHDTCSIDENCSIPTTPLREKDGWIYPPLRQESYHKGTLSPESNSNEAFLLQIQAQAAPNRNLFPSGNCSLTNSPRQIDSPMVSPFPTSQSIFGHHPLRGIAFPPPPPLSSLNQSGNLSPLLSYYPLMDTSPVFPLSLSSFSSFLLHEPSQVTSPQQLQPLPSEIFLALSENHHSGITVFQRNSDLFNPSLEYALLLPHTLFLALFGNTLPTKDNHFLQELSLASHCQISYEEIFHQDTWEHFLIFSPIFSERDDHERDLMMTSLNIALEIITEKGSIISGRDSPSHHNHPLLLHDDETETEDYSHLLESAEFLLAGTPIKVTERER
jgi:hypothetical protein